MEIDVKNLKITFTEYAKDNWRASATFEALDTKRGVPGTFRFSRPVASKSKRQMLRFFLDFLEHELEEQFGLDPPHTSNAYLSASKGFPDGRQEPI